MRDPTDILARGLKVVWDANSATLSDLGTPSLEEKQQPTEYPYVVIEIGDADPVGWTCDSQFYEIDVVFRVYDNGKEECSDHIEKILSVFGDENLQITLSVGSAFKKREGRSSYERQDKTVWRGSQYFSFTMNIPRRK